MYNKKSDNDGNQNGVFYCPRAVTTMVLGSLSRKLKRTSLDESPSKETSEQEANIESTDDVDEIDDQNQSILLSIIAQLRPGCDLTRITLPTFILEKKSMLERITNAFYTPQILLEANDTDDAVERFLLVVKWYLSCWHIAPKAVKKPLNPILGEVFACQWPEIPGGSSAHYISEQTSHHPPESSYFYVVPEKKIRVDGVVIPKSKFLGNSSAAMMEGVANLTLGERNDEVYTLTQPNVYCRGILFGKLRYELGDHMLIKCTATGLEADIDFKTKGFLGGTYDSIEGVVKNSKTSETLYVISGKWNGVMEIKRPSESKSSIFYDTSNPQLYKPAVKPIEEQNDYESRKLWLKTVQALDKRDHEEATNEKFKVEDDQRVLAKERSEKQIEYEQRLFRLADSSSSNLPYIIRSDIDIDCDGTDAIKQKVSNLYSF